MNNRQQRIIDILHDYDEWVTGKELASMLSVSDRTIRSDIEHINKEYECTLIEANRRKGYHLDEMLTSVKGITTKSGFLRHLRNVYLGLLRNYCLNRKSISLNYRIVFM